jgi:hypothetical protein
MLRIVANQLKLNGLLLFTVFFVSNAVYLILARWQGMLSFGKTGIEVAIATASVMILGLFLREEQGKCQVMYRSLPLRHSTIVSAMYFLVVIVMLANLAYALSLEFINAHIGPWMPERFRHYIVSRLFDQFESGYAAEHSLLVRALAITIVTSISIPLIVRYGSMWRILLGYMVVIMLWGRVVDHLLRLSLNTGFFLGLSRWIAFAIVLMMISLGLSWRISVWLYGQRDL